MRATRRAKSPGSGAIAGGMGSHVAADTATSRQLPRAATGPPVPEGMHGDLPLFVRAACVMHDALGMPHCVLMPPRPPQRLNASTPQRLSDSATQRLRDSAAQRHHYAPSLPAERSVDADPTARRSPKPKAALATP
ncbi:unnamed protein product, partial [Iphiclides podalirius]